MLSRLVAPFAAVVALLLMAPTSLVLAQIDPQVRDRVVPAVVQIALLVDVTENGMTVPEFLPIGSGTIIAPDGLILTNHHVVDMAAHQAQLEVWEAQAAAEGTLLTLSLNSESVLVLGTAGVSQPEPLYMAQLVVDDPHLDLAVLRIVASALGEPLAAGSVTVPFVPLGDSSSLGLGDPIHLFGYPAAGGGALTYTPGVVSGVLFEDGVDGVAWFTTDATMSGGSSGGAAIDRAGRLVGVPTQGSSLDCRPGDTNGDGTIDERDVGCVPTGGSIGQLRPISLAESVLQRADLTVARVEEEPVREEELVREEGPVRIGSKDFTEQLILGEMYALLLENAGIATEKSLNLGGTQVAHEALLAGEIDLYPEYTGTGLMVVLGMPISGFLPVYDNVSGQYRERFDLVWLDQSAFNNTQALAMKRSVAEQLGISTLSELADVAGDLTIVAPSDFVERPDGLQGLEDFYDLEFGNVLSVAPGIRYQALEQDQAQVVLAFGTDGQMAGMDLVLLEDDKGLWPPYHVAPVVRNDTLTANPGIADALNPVAPLLTDQVMSALNWKVDGPAKLEPIDVARAFLEEQGLLGG